MSESESLSSLFLRRVIPVAGVLSYEAFAVHICNPSLITRFLSPQTSQNLITCLIYNTNIAAAIYLFYRPHISILPAPQKILFSAFGSMAFNFSSFFFWIMARDVFKEDWQKAIFAFTTATSMVLIAGDYLQYIDSLASE